VEKAEVAVEEILKIGIDNAMNRLNWRNITKWKI
jgi:hypothetical protein